MKKEKKCQKCPKQSAHGNKAAFGGFLTFIMTVIEEVSYLKIL